MGLSTLILVAATFYSPFLPAEAGVAGLVLPMAQASAQWEQRCCPALGSYRLYLCLVSTLLAGLHVGWRDAENDQWKIFHFQTTYVQIKPDTSNNARGLDGILQKMDLSSADVSWLHFLDFVAGWTSWELLHIRTVIVEQWRSLLRLEKRMENSWKYLLGR